ncbi:gamma-glutamyl-gamma-aminobutyrate hydrolase family protein, partial [Geobacillus stearothermophilus]
KHDSLLFHGLPDEQVVWMSHGDLVTALPDGFVVDATSPSCPIAAMSDERRKWYGVQFHPEVRHSVYGNDLLKKFVFDVCGCRGDWTMENFIDEQVRRIREQVGEKRVLCALSGGVDSSVAAV